jgi:uncharacterized protein YjbI with pentapeptide repeats
METLTMFIDHLYGSELGANEYQTLEGISIVSRTYLNAIVAGSLMKDVVFEDVIFQDCTFFGTNMQNCLFINCLFINCKFQFSKFSDCNFELTSWENCMWGLTALTGSEVNHSEGNNNYSFESSGPCAQTKTLSLNEFLTVSA